MGIAATVVFGGGIVLVAAIAMGMRRLVSDLQHAEEWDWSDWPEEEAGEVS
jgi:hypothetical protein